MKFLTLAVLLLVPKSLCTQTPQDLSAEEVGAIVEDLDPRIWKIHQDRRGHMWFGSNGAGVFRFDGEELRQFTSEHGLVGMQVRDIQEDRRGHILVATNTGVSRWDGKEFSALELVQAPDAWRLDPDDVWIHFDPGNRGPCRYDGERLYQLQLPESSLADAYKAKNMGARYAPEGLYSVYRDRRGHVWFGTLAAGVCRYDGKNFDWMYDESLFLTPSGGAFGVRSIFEDRAGDFWICNTRQRFQWKPRAKTEGENGVLRHDRNPGLPDAQEDDAKNFTYFHSIVQDSSGTLWMAAGSDGLWSYDGQRVQKHRVKEESYVLHVMVDSQDRVWAGTTQRGLYRREGEGFRLWSPLTEKESSPEAAKGEKGE